MQNADAASDEPTRLANIISPMFQGQSGWAQQLLDGAKVELLAGADAQDDCAVFRIDGTMFVARNFSCTSSGICRIMILAITWQWPI
jgi:hypothetical protein